MATDYISRDYAVENMENFPWDTEHDRNAAIHLVRELVPAADVRPVVRGRWNRYVYDKKLWANYCSACKTFLPYGMDWEPNFCPNCGADMREVDNG